MKIVHISTHDTGGAAMAGLRLHRALLKSDIDSNFLVLYKNFEYDGKDKIFRFLDDIPNNKRLVASVRYKIYFFLNKLIRAFVREVKLPFSPYNLWDHPLVRSADVIHLHWVCDFLDYSSFFKGNTKRIVWTLHDENPYSYGYNYETDIVKRNSFVANWLYFLKKKSFSKDLNMIIVCPSNWILERSLSMKTFSHYKHVQISNGVDKEIFFPAVNKSELIREKYNFGKHECLILSVSQHINNKIKGFKYLIDAFQLIRNDGVKLILVGKSNMDVSGVSFLGTIEQEDTLASVYRSADIFVIPSVLDNSPNTIIEALMCGVPVVGFNTGGVAEAIEKTLGGMVLKNISATELANQLLDLTSNPEKLKSLKNNAIQNAQKFYDIDIVALKYRELAYGDS